MPRNTFPPNPGPALTDEDAKTRRLLISWMEEARLMGAASAPDRRTHRLYATRRARRGGPAVRHVQPVRPVLVTPSTRPMSGIHTELMRQQEAGSDSDRVDNWFRQCFVTAFAGLSSLGFVVEPGSPAGPSPRACRCSNGHLTIIVDYDVLEGELLVRVAWAGKEPVDLVSVLDPTTARSLHLQRLPRSASKGVVTSRLRRAAIAIQMHLLKAQPVQGDS